MGAYSLLIFFFLVSITFSFLCSVWEAVLLSITPAYAELELQKGTKVGHLLQSFKQKISRPLSAILTLNTIAHTVGAMGVGAQAEAIWSSSAGLSIPFINVTIGANAVVGVVMTLAILILSEIIPKTIGANYWKALTPFTVKSLNFIIIALYPLVYLCELITTKLKKEKTGFSRVDFSATAKLSQKDGALKQSEYRIIDNLLRFSTILAKDVMTPRTVVIAAEENMTIQAFYEKHPNLRFSRIPIYDKSKDNINGFFMKDDMLSNIIQKNGDAPLKSIIREIMIINDTFPIPELFNKFMEKREHVALIVDEFGGMSGIVTMEDVIETLLGLEIMDEFDNTDDMQALARKKWEQRAKNLGIIDEKINS